MIIENYEFIKCIIGIVALVLCCIMLVVLIYGMCQMAKLEKEQRKEIADRRKKIEEKKEIDRSKDVDDTINQTYIEVEEYSEPVIKWANYEITTDEAANILKIGTSTVYKKYGHLRRNNRNKK